MTERLAITALLGAILAGCSVTATQIYGRDGNPYQYIQCDGLFRTLDDCYVKAAQTCPTGYQITDGVAPRDFYDSSLIIRCK